MQDVTDEEPLFLCHAAEVGRGRVEGVVDSARPQVERGISKAQQQAQKITKRGSDSGGGSATAYGGSAGTGSGSAPSPGV